MARDTIIIDGGELAMAAADAQGVRCFKGIPFAAPPVGALRWRPPQPVVPWTGVRPVDVFGRNSMQSIVFGDIDPHVVGIPIEGKNMRRTIAIVSLKEAYEKKAVKKFHELLTRIQI